MTQNQPPITSKTGVFGVIGSPIEHSLSPLLHNYVLSRLGLDYRYLAFQVTSEYLAGLAEVFVDAMTTQAATTKGEVT